MTTDEIEAFALSQGHPPVAQGVVCVDFDSTIRDWGGLFEFNEPFEGAREFLHDLKAQGFTLVMFTSRLSTVWHASEGRDPAKGIFEQVEFLRKYCERYDLPFDRVTGEKVPALAYIDDKAIEYLNWPQVARRFKKKVGKRG